MRILLLVLILSLMIFVASCGGNEKGPAVEGGQKAGKILSDGDVSGKLANDVDDEAGAPYGLNDDLGDVLGDDEEVARRMKFSNTMKIVEGLASPDAGLQAKAMEDLMAMGPEAVPGLEASLTHDSHDIRAKGAMALGKLGDVAADAVPELIDSLSDEVGLVRVEAATALGRIGAAAQPALARLKELVNTDTYLQTTTNEDGEEVVAQEVFPVKLAAEQAIAMIERALKEAAEKG
jgi:hypothetical protein